MVEEFGAGAQKGTGAMQFALERDRFRPNWRRGEVLTKRCKSTYSPIYDKGWLVMFECSSAHTHTLVHITRTQVLWMRVWIAIRMDTPATVWSFQ